MVAVAGYKQFRREYIVKEIREARLKIYQGAYHSIPVESAEELCVDLQ